MRSMFLAGVIACLGLSPVVPASAADVPQPTVNQAEIDAVVARAMEAFSVPGVAIGVVKDGQLVLAKGYGVRDISRPDAVGPDTLFAIGSITKAFTSAALAILIDDGKLRWDDKVIDHIPQFRLHDPYVTREFTIRDLLTHRSGLGLGAGDLMMFPTTDFTRREIIENLRHLRPVSSFRSEFAYDNLLYIVAGEIIPAVTGTSWEDFVEKRILQRVGMQPCAAFRSRITGTQDIAHPHAFIEGKLVGVEAEDLLVAGAAGSIQCNISSMAKWVSVQLAAGKTSDGTQLFSAERSAEMWSPQTILSVPPTAAKLNRTHFRSYGLGWGLEDFEGYKRVSHSGGVLGTVTHVSLVPERNLGVIVLTNQQSGEAVNALTLHLLKAYLGVEQSDWVTILKKARDEQEAAMLALEAKPRAASKKIAKSTTADAVYVGTYRDAWRGDATIRQENGKLVLTFSRTQRMSGVLEPVSPALFVVRWKDRTLEADAYVRFAMGYEGDVEGMTMRAVSSRTDFSFDFHDLDFRKVKQ